MRRARLRLSLHGTRLRARLNDFGTLSDLSIKIVITLEPTKTLSTFGPRADSKISTCAKLRKWRTICIDERYSYMPNLYTYSLSRIAFCECNKRIPPTTIYFARDTVPTKWTTAPRDANNRSLPNALNRVNSGAGLYVRSKTIQILSRMPRLAIWISILQVSLRHYYATTAPESGTSLTGLATNYLKWIQVFEEDESD